MRGVAGTTPGHGTRPCYRHGCRCAACKAAEARYFNRRTLDKAAGVAYVIDGTGTIRRLRALAAIGWSAKSISVELGCGEKWIRQLRMREGAPVLVETAEKVARVYDALSGKSSTSTRSRTIARRNGWAPPLAWDDIDTDAAPDFGAVADDDIDDVVIERAMSGLPVQLTTAERTEIVRRLAHLRYNDARIAERLGLNVRSVLRIRSAHGIESRWVA